MGAGNVVEGKRPWGLLAQRDFRLLWLGETTSSLGNTVTTVVTPLTAVTLLGANPLAVGVLNAAAWLPWLVIGLPAGAWVDRLRRRPIMLAADFVSLALFAGILVAAWQGVLSLPLLMVVALLGGTASVFFSTAYRALLPSLVAREDLLEGNSKLQGSEQGARTTVTCPKLRPCGNLAACDSFWGDYSSAPFSVSCSCSSMRMRH
jgi:MFS family permease